MYQSIIKPLAFLLSPERAHSLVTKSFIVLTKTPVVSSIVRSFYRVSDPSLKRNVFGLNFDNPVGLAAGFDKDGKYYDAMSALGFGFIEIGTVTPLGQEGNPQPRLFRLPEDRALINRMGFNNDGVEAMVSRLKKRKKNSMIVGGNIGKNKLTPNENAKDDYAKCFTALYEYVDYFVVNVSSPNTPGLRSLQDKGPLKEILNTVHDLNNKEQHQKPILLKIAPDLTEGQLDDIIEIVQETRTHGIIATNTTIARAPLTTDTNSVEAIGNGGLSGDPVRDRSTEVISYIYKKTNGSIPIIGVGGISNPESAKEKIKAGASLIQIYSGLVYEGPGLVKRINKSLINN